MLAACGRLGFDRQDLPTDAALTGSTFQPAASNCLAADAGPFVALAQFPTAGGGYGLWSAAPYLLEADTTGGLHSLRFDGHAFSELDHLPNLGWVEAVVGDGTYFYVGAPGTGFYVVALSAGGDLSIEAMDLSISEARHAWPGNGRIYIPAGGDGLFAVRFDGTAITHVGTSIGSLSWAQGAWADGDHVYLADNDRFRVLDFDGAVFTEALSPSSAHPGTSRIWRAGDTLFVGAGDGLVAHHLANGMPTELARFPTAAAVRDVWSDGQHVFVAAEGDGLYALSFDGAAFHELDHVQTTGQTLGVFGDGTYVFTNDQAEGVRAYTGFACRDF